MGSSASALESARLVRTLISNEPAPDEALTQLLNMPMTDAEAAQAFPVDQLRRLRHQHSRNFAALLHRCIGAVAAVAVRRAEVNTTAALSSTIVTAELHAPFLAALRLLRHLLPVALEGGATPVENEGEAEKALTNSLASAEGVEVTPTPAHRTVATLTFQQLFFVQGRTCDDGKPEETFPALPGQNKHLSPSHPYAKPVPLGTFLVWALVECCFIRGISLPEETVLPAEPELSLIHSEVDAGLMWCPGIASADPLKAFAVTRRGPSFTWAAPKLPLMRNRLLALLLISLSSPLYNEAGFRDTIFLEPLLSTTTVPLMPTLTVSMLNTILQFVPYGYLPYTSHLGVEELQLTESCSRVLDATLSYIGIPLEPASTPQEGPSSPLSPAPLAREPSAKLVTDKRVPTAVVKPYAAVDAADAVPMSASGSESQPLSSIGSTPSESAAAPLPLSVLRSTDHSSLQHGSSFSGATDGTSSLTHSGPPRFVHSGRKTLRDITITEAKAVIDRMQSILGVNAYANQTYLPTSQNRFNSLDEFMLLFWKLLDLSQPTLAQFGSSPHALDYVIPILDYALEVRRSPLYIYRFQLILFILTRLSEVRGFVLQCNQVCSAIVPFRFPKLSPTHTYNDLIVCALCVVMEMKDIAHFTPLFPSCTVILANMAPFITTIDRIPSIKLVSVFAHVTYRCLRAGPSSRTSPSLPLEHDHRAAAQSNGSESAIDLMHQSMMVNLCEAIASLLQYQPGNSLYVLAALVDHRAVVREAREAYIVQRTKVLAGVSPLPFLINTLDAAVAVALPVVESTDAMRKLTKYYMDTTSPEAVSNATAALEKSGAFMAPVSMGEAGTGLAASDEAILRLRTLTLVGVLPTPHSIVTRKFQSTKGTEQWTTTTFWTSAYVHSDPGTLGDRDSVKLVQFV